MPDIRPFRGLTYNTERAGAIKDLVAPPYDIIFDEWRDRLYDRNPYNIIRLIKTKDEPGDSETVNRYTRANDFLEHWKSEGVLVHDERPALYVTSDRFTWDGEEHTRFGFIALIRLEEFGGNIHAHERTLAAPKADRMKLVMATRTNLSQIFGVYQDPSQDLQRLILSVAEGEPEVSFVDEQEIERRVWRVEDPALIARFQDALRTRNIIIADGHHRYETALAYQRYSESTRTQADEPFDFVSMYFSCVDAPGMLILPTHRRVSDLPGFTPESFFTKLDALFDITMLPDITLPELLQAIQEGSGDTTVFGLATAHGFAIARLRTPSTPKELDVEVLHNRIIEDMLGINREDISQGRFLHFSKSAEHAWESITSGTDQVAIFMNPVTPPELFRVVLEGRRMPQKSTYFHPKTMSGLVMFSLDKDTFAR